MRQYVGHPPCRALRPFRSAGCTEDRAKSDFSFLLGLVATPLKVPEWATLWGENRWFQKEGEIAFRAVLRTAPRPVVRNQPFESPGMPGLPLPTCKKLHHQHAPHESSTPGKAVGASSGHAVYIDHGCSLQLQCFEPMRRRAFCIAFGAALSDLPW